MRTNTNGKQAITGRTAARKASAEGTGQGQEQGQSDGGHLGASGAVGGGVKGTPPPKDGTGFRLLPGRPLGKITRHRTDSQNTPPLDLTDTERAIVQAAIETELYTIQKQSTADFQHAQRAILRECMRLDFLSADARRRLSACPLPSKAEALADLHRLLNFVR
jgi:hypothetical protein